MKLSDDVIHQVMSDIVDYDSYWLSIKDFQRNPSLQMIGYLSNEIASINMLKVACFRVGVSKFIAIISVSVSWHSFGISYRYPLRYQLPLQACLLFNISVNNIAFVSSFFVQK